MKKRGNNNNKKYRNSRDLLICSRLPLTPPSHPLHSSVIFSLLFSCATSKLNAYFAILFFSTSFRISFFDYHFLLFNSFDSVAAHHQIKFVVVIVVSGLCAPVHGACSPLLTFFHFFFSLAVVVFIQSDEILINKLMQMKN